MALIECAECGRDVSDTRPDCPHCGAYREGQAPRQVEAVDPELKQLAQERKFKSDMLQALERFEFSDRLMTYKDGTTKKKRSLAFSYQHGEVTSFNSYVDTDVDVGYTTVREVTGMTSHYQGYNTVRHDVHTRSHRVVSDVATRKTKVTEIAVRHSDGRMKKYYFRGSEIEFLKPGDPITIGFLEVSWEQHTDDPGCYERYGLAHNGDVCPVMVINRAMDAHHSSSFITDPAVFKDQIFHAKIGKWMLIFPAAFVLDLITSVRL